MLLNLSVKVTVPAVSDRDHPSGVLMVYPSGEVKALYFTVSGMSPGTTTLSGAVAPGPAAGRHVDAPAEVLVEAGAVVPTRGWVDAPFDPVLQDAARRVAASRPPARREVITRATLRTGVSTQHRTEVSGG